MKKRMTISNTHSTLTKPAVQRTCIACRQIKDKRDLVRLVRTPEGNIEIDNIQKKEGRGAYLCATRECWETALKGNQMEHAFRSRLTQDNREKLMAQGKEFLKELISG